MVQCLVRLIRPRSSITSFLRYSTKVGGVKSEDVGEAPDRGRISEEESAEWRGRQSARLRQAGSRAVSEVDARVGVAQGYWTR